MSVVEPDEPSRDLQTLGIVISDDFESSCARKALLCFALLDSIPAHLQHPCCRDFAGRSAATRACQTVQWTQQFG